MRFDSIILTMVTLYVMSALLWYIAYFIPSEEGSFLIGPPNSALPTPIENISTPIQGSPKRINGAVTVGVLLYLIGLGAPAVGVLGLLLVLLAYHEGQQEYSVCVRYIQ